METLVLESIVTILVYAIESYLMLGALFAMAFHVRGLTSLDHATEGAKPFFRVLITPGLVALWPVILRKWIRLRQGKPTTPDYNEPVTARALRRRHALTMQLGLVLLPPLLAIAIAFRGAPPSTARPTQQPEPTTLSPDTTPVED